MTANAMSILRGIEDVFFPPVCVHCQGLVEGSALRHLCSRCARQVEMVHAPHCTTCGHPFYGEVSGEHLCPHCQSLSPAFREGRTAVLMKGPARSLVHALKYHRSPHVLADMETIFGLSQEILGFARGAVLVPVPLHSQRERERGYNQSEMLAGGLARAAGGDCRVELLLRREINTVSQTHHDRKARMENLKNAFALMKGTSITPAQHYILIDDVFTTGSTLNSCALVLRRAGCLNLDVITFGHG